MGINLPGEIAVDIRQPIVGDSFGWAGLEAAAAKKVIVIHATASQARDEDGFTMAGYHVNTNGWGGIGVHFVVTKDNYPGRAFSGGSTPGGAHVQYVGDLLTYRAGVLNNNPGRVHIEISGLFTAGNGVPSEGQLRATRRLIDFLLSPNELLPSLNFYNQVDFHNHQAVPGGQTACPGWNHPQFNEWFKYLQGGPEPSWFGKPAPAPAPAPAPSAPNVPSSPVTDVRATVGIVVDTLNVRRLPTKAAEIAGQFQRGEAEITGWTTGETVSLEQDDGSTRTSNIWLRSLNGNWAAQVGTNARFGENAPAPAPIPAPDPPKPEPPKEPETPEYERTWLEDHTIGQKVVAVPQADVIDAVTGKVVKKLPGGELVAEIAGYFKIGGSDYVRTQFALDHGKWNGIALNDLKTYEPPVVQPPINPNAPVDSIQPPADPQPPYEEPEPEPEPELPTTPVQPETATPEPPIDAWRKFIEILVSIILVPLRLIGRRFNKKGN
jgi:hypothetical protein